MKFTKTCTKQKDKIYIVEDELALNELLLISNSICSTFHGNFQEMKEMVQNI